VGGGQDWGKKKVKRTQPLTVKKKEKRVVKNTQSGVKSTRLSFFLLASMFPNR